MVNWYYVQGSERVGPVSEEVLRDLFHKEILGLESYVWKKGFINWTILKDVEELNFQNNSDVKITEPCTELTSEISIKFDWDTTSEEKEIFFIKTGKDRKQQLQKNLYGPYSLNELKEAMEAKCINNHTWIFSAGMSGWIEIGKTPIDPKNLKINSENVEDETPLFITWKSDQIPFVALVQESGLEKCTLLGRGPFKAGQVVVGSLCVKDTLSENKIKLTIVDYRPKEQKIFCNINEMSDTIKGIMKNYAN